MFLLNKNVRYEPVVSNVSNKELINTVKELEKSENVMTLTPFDVFKSTRLQHGCFGKKPKVSEIYKFNPIRSKEAMSELGKKRWVSFVMFLYIVIFTHSTPNLCMSAGNLSFLS